MDTNRPETRALREALAEANRRFESMLAPAEAPAAEPPLCADLAALNTRRVILDAVGASALDGILRDVVDMLGTSAAAYEDNGDYALGILSSGWCRALCTASRERCGTSDHHEALGSGRWLCHESSWSEASKASMARREAVDVGCAGGLRVCSVPVIAGGRVVGAVNFGYGDPPTDQGRIAEIARAYGLDAEVLAEQARAYVPRPAFLVEMARRRLHACARLIGEIVERRRAEEVSSVARRQWQVTFDRSADAIFLLDRRMCIVRANRAALSFWGCDHEDVLGRDCCELIHGTRIRHPQCPVAVMRGSHRRENVELVLKGAWHEVTVEPIFDAAGELAGAVHRVRNVDERKRLQAQVAQTDRLASMGMLAAGVAHEINNPLSYVLYNLESVADELPRVAAWIRAQRDGEAGGPPFDPSWFDDASARLRDALDGARRIKQISRSLGTFSRVEDAALDPVDVRVAVGHALDMAFNEIKRRARLVKDFGPTPKVLATEGRLAQVFLNLVVNAAHAIGEGNVDGNEIRVRTGSGGDRVWVEVADTGAGIAPEDLPRVFDPFFTTKRVGVGTGLGLAICKKIVADFGGEIGVESEPGRGARFRVSLPAAPPERKAASWAPAEATPPARRGRVLVVDDEDAVVAAIARLLGRDHEVVCSTSGGDARARLEGDRRFDAVLLDVDLPDGEAMGVHAWLAEVEPSVAQRVVFLTGGASTPRERGYLATVLNPCVEKPFEAEGLRRVVGMVVEGPNPSPPVREGPPGPW